MIERIKHCDDQVLVKPGTTLVFGDGKVEEESSSFDVPLAQAPLTMPDQFPSGVSFVPEALTKSDDFFQDASIGAAVIGAGQTIF